MNWLTRVAVVVALSSWASAALATKPVSLEDRRQAACYDDVQRLCPNTIPDAAKAEACMKDKKSKVSKKCAALWDEEGQ